jgi:hypothetical protein
MRGRPCARNRLPGPAAGLESSPSMKGSLDATWVQERLPGGCVGEWAMSRGVRLGTESTFDKGENPYE